MRRGQISSPFQKARSPGTWLLVKSTLIEARRSWGGQGACGHTVRTLGTDPEPEAEPGAGRPAFNPHSSPTFIPPLTDEETHKGRDLPKVTSKQNVRAAIQPKLACFLGSTMRFTDDMSRRRTCRLMTSSRGAALQPGWVSTPPAHRQAETRVLGKKRSEAQTCAGDAAVTPLCASQVPPRKTKQIWKGCGSRAEAGGVRRQERGRHPATGGGSRFPDLPGRKQMQERGEEFCGLFSGWRPERGRFVGR